MEQSLSPFATDLEKFNYWHDSDFLELPEYKLKIREFANKTIDFIVTKTNFKSFDVELGQGTRVIYPKERTEEEQEAIRLQNVERAARRARQQVHFMVRSLGADHMLTLTTRDNIEDRQQFDKIFQEFIRLVRHKDVSRTGLYTRKEPRHWPYVAVREKQDRGAYHMHIACVGKQDLALLRGCWYVALGGTVQDEGSDSLGAINVQYAQKRFSGQTETHKTFKLVQYLCKYIAKTFDDTDELGQRRYKASRLIPKPRTQTQYLPIYYSMGDERFPEAMKAAIAIAKFIGVENFEPWNRGLDIYILRGTY